MKRTLLNKQETIIATPRFDHDAVRHARSATPISRTTRKKSWPSALVMMCLSAGAAGGIIGGVATALLKSSDSVGTRAPAQVAASNAAAFETNKAQPQSAPSQTVSNSLAKKQPPSPRSITEPAAPENQKGARRVGKQVDGRNTDAAQAILLGSESVKRDYHSRGDESGKGIAPAATVENPAPAGNTHNEMESLTREPAKEAHAALRSALDDWIAATNARDIKKQMSFYNQKVDAFYLSRNASRAAVREEKSRVLGQASLVDIRVGDPEIKLDRDGRTATMRFRKRYFIEGGEQARRGEVLQELRWQRTDEGWRIVSERDLRVLN